MIALKDQVHQLYSTLFEGKQFLLREASFEIFLRFCPETARLEMHTQIYMGDGYVPPSVRRAVSTHGFLHLSEEDFSVHIHNSSAILYPDPDYLLHLIEDFIAFAEEWELKLRDLDGQDLVYIRVR